MVSNYRALSRAAPQQNLINDGDYMTDKKTPKAAEAASDLNAELDALRKENETLSKMVSIAAKQREKYLAIEAENRTLKDAWRLTYAGQAMKEHMTTLSNLSKVNIEDWHDEVARLSFLTADSMIRRISI